MREIRYIYIIIGVALCLQSCHKESHPSNPETESYAISMAPTSVGTSRTPINNIDDLKENGFVVYGHSTVNNTDGSNAQQQVFGGDKVTYDTNEEAWGYTNTQYWNLAADYRFGAYALTEFYQGASITKNKDEDNEDIITSLTFGNLPQWQAYNNNATDLIVATSQGAAIDYLYGSGSVDLEFQHAYAQLEVKVVKDVTLTKDYQLTGLTYSNIPHKDGKNSYTLDYTTPENSKWDDINPNEANTLPAFSGSAVVIDDKGTNTTFNHLVVPFSSQFQVSVAYTVSEGTQSTSVSGSATVDLELTPGQKMVLTLSISSTYKITPVLQIAEWEPVDIDEDDKFNW